MRSSFPLLACLCAAAAIAAPAASPPAGHAGIVMAASSAARLTSKGAAPRPIKAGDRVAEGDLIESGNDGEVHVRMRDGGFIAMRPGTRLEVTRYLADGGDSDTSILRLVSGGIRSISGWIGKYNPASYQIKTSTATIGIRGTDHETRVVAEGSAEGEAGTYDRVYAGETVIETAEGKTTVKENQAGFQPARGRGRVLAAVPRFYRPGPNEAEISRKHGEIQAEIAERREERRKAVIEKREEFHDARAKARDLVKEEAARQGLKPTREDKAQKRALKESIDEDKRAADELEEEIARKGAALEEDAKSGRVGRAELKERRDQLATQKKELDRMREGIKEKKKAKEAAKDARTDAVLGSSSDEALRRQVGEAREKRKAFRDERQSAKDEIKEAEREERRRYKEEMKADRKVTP